MKTLFAKCTVEMTTDEVALVNDLIRKAVPVAVNEYDGTMTKYYKCPSCETILIADANYCHNCGQAVDMDNIAFRKEY